VSTDPRPWKSDPGVEGGFADETARHLTLRWIVRLRYGLIAGEVALIAILSLALQIALPLGVISTAIGVQALSNWLLGSKIRRLGANAEHLAGMLFALDSVCLTLLLALSGGPANPFSPLYLVQITFSAVVLRKLWTWALGILSTFSFGLLFWISRDIPAFHDHGQPGEFSLHLMGMWVAFATAALLISFFVGKLSAESRKKEREIRLMQKQLSRNDRLASLVTLAAGAAHEMATPLSTIAVTSKEMEQDAAMRLRDRRMEEDAQLIRSQVERCRLILERMGAQGADPFGEAPKSIEFGELLELVRERFPHERKRIQIVAAAGHSRCATIPVRAAAEALSALVKNALDASPEESPVVLQAVEMDAGGTRFLIRDEGSGMTAEVLDRVAEPFFTTKAVGQGMGLGAFLAHLFAQALGGHLLFESEPGRGCTAILELPGMNHGNS
jgi:two-component system sensor histidine kinase RegB